jgi:hypothetical protein
MVIGGKLISIATLRANQAFFDFASSTAIW